MRKIQTDMQMFGLPRRHEYIKPELHPQGAADDTTQA
jgi:hypothetical protein